MQKSFFITEKYINIYIYIDIYINIESAKLCQFSILRLQSWAPKVGTCCFGTALEFFNSQSWALSVFFFQ